MFKNMVERLNTRTREKGDSNLAADETQPSYSRETNVVAFRTSDPKMQQSVSSVKDIPLGKYTSLGVILESNNIRDARLNHPLPVFNPRKETLPKNHLLGPLQPGKSSSSSPRRSQQQPYGGYTQSQSQQQAGGGGSWNQPQPPHDGLVWPMAWAPTPPYTAPGYNQMGHQQPIGVIQVDRIPSTPSRGRTDKLEYDLPTWVSPLYRTYGIGGPFGPFGPFYEPPCLDALVDIEPAIEVDYSADPQEKKRFFGSLFSKKAKLKPHVKVKDEDDEVMTNYLRDLDDNLMVTRRSLRVKDSKSQIMAGVLNSLSRILQDAKLFAKHVEAKEEEKKKNAAAKLEVQEKDKEKTDTAESGKVQEKDKEKTDTAESGKVQEKDKEKTDTAESGKVQEKDKEKTDTAESGKVQENDKEKTDTAESGKVQEKDKEKTDTAESGKVQENDKEKTDTAESEKKEKETTDTAESEEKETA